MSKVKKVLKAKAAKKVEVKAEPEVKEVEIVKEVVARPYRYFFVNPPDCQFVNQILAEPVEVLMNSTISYTHPDTKETMTDRILIVLDK